MVIWCSLAGSCNEFASRDDEKEGIKCPFSQSKGLLYCVSNDSSSTLDTGYWIQDTAAQQQEISELVLKTVLFSASSQKPETQDIDYVARSLQDYKTPRAIAG